jgi:hypothetical protein
MSDEYRIIRVDAWNHHIGDYTRWEIQHRETRRHVPLWSGLLAAVIAADCIPSLKTDCSRGDHDLHSWPRRGSHPRRHPAHGSARPGSPL